MTAALQKGQGQTDGGGGEQELLWVWSAPVTIKEGPPVQGYVQDAKRVAIGHKIADPRQTWRGDLCRRESGSGLRGPKPQVYRAMKPTADSSRIQFVPQSNLFLLQTSLEEHQGVQDWTSVPPPEPS